MTFPDRGLLHTFTCNSNSSGSVVNRLPSLDETAAGPAVLLPSLRRWQLLWSIVATRLLVEAGQDDLSRLLHHLICCRTLLLVGFIDRRMVVMVMSVFGWGEHSTVSHFRLRLLLLGGGTLLRLFFLGNAGHEGCPGIVACCVLEGAYYGMCSDRTIFTASRACHQSLATHAAI